MSTVAKRLYATDETFREVADLLFGSGGDELIAKMNPDGADLNARRKDTRNRKVTAGLSAVGAGAGALGLAAGANEVRTKAKEMGSLKAGWKASSKLGRALIPVEIAGLTGEIAATKILHGDVKHRKPIKKNITRGRLTRMAMEQSMDTGKAVADSESAKKAKNKLKKLPERVKVKKSVEESFDVVWRGEISKIDTDRRQVFGWASIVEMNGEPVVDLQGDYISIDEIEKSAYSYVQKSRKGGDMHKRDGAEPHLVSDMIESFVVTPEKIEKMGLPKDSVPTGWWVGYQVHDDETWNLVKSKQRTGFSIHGSGTRKAI